MQKSTTASSSGRTNGMSVLLLPLRQGDRADQCGEQQYGEDLEGKDPTLEDLGADRGGRSTVHGFDLLVAEGKHNTGAEDQREDAGDHGGELAPAGRQLG